MNHQAERQAFRPSDAPALASHSSQTRVSMPFMLYDVTGNAPRSYRFVRVVRLAGRNGPLASIKIAHL